MSASTDRRNRQTARTAGTDKKTLAAQKELKKQKREKTKWIIVSAVIVLFFAFVLYLNTGAFYRGINGLTVNYPANAELNIEAGSRSFSVAECNYVYNMQYMNLVSSYGDYTSIIGLNTNQPLDEQQCGMTEEENYTWDQYFIDSTRNFLTQLTVLNAYGEKLGITLDDDDMAVIEENLASFDAATQYGYASPDKFIAGNYGRGANLSVVRDILELQQLAAKVQEHVSDGFSFTADELNEKYESVKNDYDKFDYDFYFVKAATETTVDDEGNENEEAPTEEALAAAKTTAEAILAHMTGEEMSLADAAKAEVSDAAVTEKKAVAGSEVEDAVSEWLTNADRVAGDAAALEADDGAYVVVFGSRDGNEASTEESGDMSQRDFIADGLLRDEALDKWSETVLDKATSACEIDTAFGMRYVGR